MNKSVFRQASQLTETLVPRSVGCLDMGGRDWRRAASSRPTLASWLTSVFCFCSLGGGCTSVSPLRSKFKSCEVGFCVVCIVNKFDQLKNLRPFLPVFACFCCCSFVSLEMSDKKGKRSRTAVHGKERKDKSTLLRCLFLPFLVSRRFFVYSLILGQCGDSTARTMT